MLAAGLTSSYGVEIDAIKCQKAAAFLAQTRTELSRRGAMPPWFTAVPEVSCSAIEQASSVAAVCCCSASGHAQDAVSCCPAVCWLNKCRGIVIVWPQSASNLCGSSACFTLAEA